MHGGHRPALPQPDGRLARDWRATTPEAEREAALADVASKAVSDLPRVWQQVEAELQQPLVDAQRPALEAVRDRAVAQAARARAFLTTVTPTPTPTGFSRCADPPKQRVCPDRTAPSTAMPPVGCCVPWR